MAEGGEVGKGVGREVVGGEGCTLWDVGTDWRKGGCDRL